MSNYSCPFNENTKNLKLYNLNDPWIFYHAYIITEISTKGSVAIMKFVERHTPNNYLYDEKHMVIDFAEGEFLYFI